MVGKRQMLKVVNDSHSDFPYAYVVLLLLCTLLLYSQCHSLRRSLKQRIWFSKGAASCTTHSSPWLRSTRPTAMPCTKFLSFQINVRFLPSLLIMHTCSRCWKKWLVRAIYFVHIWYFFCISADFEVRKGFGLEPKRSSLDPMCPIGLLPNRILLT